MNIFRKLGLGIVSSLLFLVLTTNAFLLAGRSIFGNPDRVKTTLAESGLYDNLLPGVIEVVTNKAGQTGPVEGFVDFSEPEVANIIESALPPDFARSSSEQAIDGGFAWLNGETEFPEVSIDLSNQSDQIIKAVADYTFKQIKDLPKCSQLQTYQLSLQENINPAELTCEPGTDLAPYKKQFIAEAKKQDFFKNPVLGTGALNNQQKEEFQRSAQDVPGQFQLLKQLPIGLIVLSVLLAFVIIFLAQTKQAGIRKLAITLLVAGALTVISSVVTTYFADKILGSGSFINSLQDAFSNEQLRSSIASSFQQLLHDFYSYVGWIGGIYIVLGVVTILGLHLYSRQQASASK